MTDTPITDAERRKVQLPDVPSDEDEELIFSNGVEYVIQIVAESLGVHPDEFSWDAATEEFEGDVRSVVGNMLTAAFGDDWDAALLRAQAAEIERLRRVEEWADNLAEALQVMTAQHGGRNTARLLKDFRDFKASGRKTDG